MYLFVNDFAIRVTLWRRYSVETKNPFSLDLDEVLLQLWLEVILSSYKMKCIESILLDCLISLDGEENKNLIKLY